MPEFYRQLISTSLPIVSEKKSSYVDITERHIQAVWLEQKYFKNLKTSDDKPIHIVSPGIWNTESGPDFLKACLHIDGTEWKGDIEIHLNEESWQQHNHHEDERYEQVILHLCLWQPKVPKKVQTKNGKPIFSCYLEPSLTIPIARLVQLIDLDLYPYKQFLGSGRCARHLFNKLPEQKILGLFHSASYWRLEQKKNFLQIRFPDPALQLAAGIAMALGYKNNTEAFLDLFTYLLEYRDYPEDELLSMALGCCGFFENRFSMWNNSPYYQQLKTGWEALRCHVTHQTQLKLDHVRPYNHPVRRIAYLVQLLRFCHFDPLWKSIVIGWDLFAHGGSVKRIKEILYLSIPSYEHPFWKDHYIFEVEKASQPLSLMGKNLKTEIIINTILPLIYHLCKEKGNEFYWNAFATLFGSFTACHTGKSNYLRQRFFGETQPSPLLNTSQAEQGAYQIHKDFCIHYEASCEGCPFVDRYLQLD